MVNLTLDEAKIVLEELGCGNFINRDKWINFTCVLHSDTKASAGLAKENLVVNCFVCGSMHLVSYVRQVKKLESNYSATKWITSLFKIGVETIELPKLSITLPYQKKDVDKNTIDEDYIKECARYRNHYLYRRGLTEEILLDFEVGYDKKKDLITVPVRDRFSNLVYVFCRNPSPFRIFHNPPNIDKKSILLGIDKVVKMKIKEIDLVEGGIDCLSNWQMGRPTVATLGVKLHYNQVNELYKAGVKTINLFLDNDTVGQANTLNMVKKLHPHFSLNKIDFPMDYKDANDLLKADKYLLLKKESYLKEILKNTIIL